MEKPTNLSGRAYSCDLATGEIQIINNTIYATEDSMFEIKYPQSDIKVYLRKNVV